VDVLPVSEFVLLSDRQPLEIVLSDELSSCSYLPGRMARLPFRLPIRPLLPHEFDQRLAAGDRRHGMGFYCPDCPECQACEAIRLDLQHYPLNKTQRRILRKGDRILHVEIAPPQLTQSRIDLFEKHKWGRGLADNDTEPIDLERYHAFIVERLVNSFEIRLWLGEALVGVAITDEGKESLSAHYTFFDPDYPHLSLGTYAILQQIRYGQVNHKRYLYLGLFVGDNAHMRYKARFLPHERRVMGEWKRFDRETIDKSFLR
jgi:arginine-tRNA-protein transferase